MRKFIDNYETFVESLKQGKEYLKQGRLSQDLLDNIVSIDPTKTKKYVGWLSKQYIIEPYNISDLKSYIEEYEVLINRNLIEKDINKFKNINDFKTEVDKVNSTKYASNKELQNDYDVILDNETLYIVRPNTFEASRKLGLSTFAHRSNVETGNKDSAWCTTYSNREHWDDYYYTHNVTFYYCKIKDNVLIDKLNKSYKTNKNTTDLNVFAVAVLDDGRLDIYDANDAQIQEPNKLTDELNISNLMVSHINKEEREQKKIINFIKIFEQEIIEGDVIIKFDLPNDIKCNTKTINGNVTFININYIPSFFKNIEIKGSFFCHNNNLKNLNGSPQTVGRDFDCSYNNLTSLKGAPQSVKGNFYCSCNNLTSLEGAPHTVGDSFLCHNNELTSLDGAPQSVGGNFDCYLNNLTTLKGAPQIVNGNFNCNRNNLITLEGAPQSVEGDFICPFNNLTSLKGAPQSVNGDFNCHRNSLTTLKGAPQSVNGDFNCYDNELTILEGAPQSVGGNFDCYNNNLTSLKGAPQSVNGDFNCSRNNLTSLEDAPQSINGNFTCTYNELTSLEGAPKEVGGDFYCLGNDLINSEHIEWLKQNCEIKGKIVK